MKQQQQWIIEFAIQEGKLDEFKTLAQEVARTVRENEPSTMVYQWYLSDDGKRCIVSELYADSDAALAHIEGEAAEKFLPRLLAIAKITRFEVYGNANEKVKDGLAELEPQYFSSLAGFSR